MAKEKVYMDYQATTPLEEDVLQSINEALKHAWGNPSSSYPEGKSAKIIIEQGRFWVAKMINAQPQDIIFTSGGTESNNMVMYSAITHFYKHCNNHNNKKGQFKNANNDIPHFITSNIEHDSVVKHLEHLEKCGKIEVTYVPVSHNSGCVDVDDVISAIKPNTCLITVMMANNETGILQPIAEISHAVRGFNKTSKRNILIHTDAAQAIGKVLVDVKEMNVDYLTIVGHKFYAPRNGALYFNSDNLDKVPMYPLLFGGGQERNFRPGTENTGMIAGLGKAAELVCSNLDHYSSHMSHIKKYLEEKILKTFGSENVNFNGKFQSSKQIPNVCNVSFPNSSMKGYEILQKCNVLQASVGAACHSELHDKPSHILLAVGIKEDVARSAIRLSVGRHTTENDVDLVVADLKQAILEV